VAQPKEIKIAKESPKEVDSPMVEEVDDPEEEII
jgi:hypothetical protein